MQLQQQWQQCAAENNSLHSQSQWQQPCILVIFKNSP
jgi:hypothetical protein